MNKPALFGSLFLIATGLSACIPVEVKLRGREQIDHSICLKRGGEYENVAQRFLMSARSA